MDAGAGGQAEPRQGEKEWTIYVCDECGREVADPGCEHQGPGYGKSSEVKVVCRGRADRMAEAAAEILRGKRGNRNTAYYEAKAAAWNELASAVAAYRGEGE